MLSGKIFPETNFIAEIKLGYGKPLASDLTSLKYLQMDPNFIILLQTNNDRFQIEVLFGSLLRFAT